MVEDATVLVAIASGIAILGIGMWRNRSEIKSVKTSIYGSPEENGGQASEIRDIGESLDKISDQMKEERESRIHNHHAIETEIRTNRFLITRSIDELVQEINEESDEIDLDRPDVRVPEELDVETRYTDNSEES